MFKTIEWPADCEVRSVIRFLNARNVKPVDIHHQICEVYDENAMSDGMVKKWVRQFNEGRENVHDEARSGRPSVVNDDLVRAVDKKAMRTNGSQFRRFPCISHRFQGLFSMKLCQIV
jgi:hypothetical protein